MKNEIGTQLRLVGSAIAYRSRASAALFVLAIGAAIAAAVGPLYLTAANASVVSTALQAAAPDQVGLYLTPSQVAPATPAQLDAAATAVPTGPGGRPWFEAPIVTVDDGGGLGHYVADLVSRTGVCAHLTFVAGHCASGNGEVVISARTAAALGVKLGQPVSFGWQGHAQPLTVVGLIAPGDPNAPYWWSLDYFTFGQAASPAAVPLDAFFTTQATVEAIGGQKAQTVLQLPIDPADVQPGDVGPLQSAVAAYQQVAAQRYHVSVTTAAAGTFAEIDTEGSQMASIVGVVGLQLVLLALLVLYAVAARTSESREPELALAALRGLRPRSTVGWALLEPGLVLGAAMPAGLLLAWLGVSLAAPHVLPDATAPGLTLAAIGAVVLTLVASILTLGAASRRLLRPGLAGDLRIGLAGPRRSRANAVEGAVLALAVAALVELLRNGVASAGHTDTLAAFAPGLIAIALALLGRRLLPAISRLGVRMTAHSPAVGWFLAFRQVARRTETWRQLLELTVATSLATFAISAWVVAAGDRVAQAQFVTGAQAVLTVQPVAPATLIADVQSADPTGRSAMAVVRYQSSSQDLLAVDARRFAAVASWPSSISGFSPAQVASMLHPLSAPPVYLSGRGVRLLAYTPGEPSGEPNLNVSVFDVATQSSTTIDLGPIGDGEKTYSAPFGPICGRGCRLTAIGPVWPSTATASGKPLSLSLSIGAIQDQAVGGRWRTVPAGIASPSNWRGTSTTVAPTQVDAVPALLCRFLLSPEGQQPVVQPSDAPPLLPAIFTPQLAAADQTDLNVGGTPIEGLDGSTINAQVVGTASAIPGTGSDAVLVDLPDVALDQTAGLLDATDQVWLDTSDYAPVEHRLQALGLQTLSVSLASTLEHQESNGAAALADLFLLLAGAVALVLAAGTSLVLLLTERRQRGPVIAALRATGVNRRMLRTSLVLEQVIVVTAGALIGTLAGALAAAIVLKSTPIVTALAGGPPLGYTVPVVPVVATFGAVVVTLSAMVWLGIRAALQAGSVGALRVKAR